MTGSNRNNNQEVTFEIREFIGALDGANDNGWRRELNLVSWNGGAPKLDIREWSPDHTKMSRGITLTEEQVMKMTKALVDRYRTRASHEHSTPVRDDYAR